MSELINQLGIDWRLLLAQVVNFLILLYVLKRFAFEPLKKALHNRQKTLERGLEDAKKAEEERENLRTLRQELRIRAQKEAEVLLGEARMKGAKEYEEYVKKAEKRAGEIVALAKQEIVNEKEKALGEARGELGAMVMMATEKVLREKVDERKDREFIERALKEIR